MKRFFSCLILFLIFCSSSYCAQNNKGKLSTIHIIDRNGFSETLSASERLKQYENVNFFTTQPYEKVCRVYQRDSQGNIFAYIHAYYENGQPKQYLEIMNGRAYGNYWEWHMNGAPKLEAFVVGGEADIDPPSQKTWLFDGICRARDEEGHLITEIPYQKGELEGVAEYYHVSGAIWKLLPYCKNELEGIATIYQSDGQLLQSSEYSQGKRHGKTMRYWAKDKIAGKEDYVQGRLVEGTYYDTKGLTISSVKEGTGLRPVFGKANIAEMHEFKNGVEEGEVKIYGEEGELLRCYHVKDDHFHGEDLDYYPEKPYGRPKLSVLWVDGQLQGEVKTWYPNGTMQSRREILNNKKNGVLMAWYKGGSLMMIEEYEKDKLVKGEYYKESEQSPITRITEGNGIAMFYDPDGNFLNRIIYKNGKPEK